MYSKLKLIGLWTFSVLGGYIFWLLCYYVLVRFASSELVELGNGQETFMQGLSFSGAFWYLIYLASVLLTAYLLYLFAARSPKPLAASLIIGTLIAASVVIIIFGLSHSISFIRLLPHLLLNITYLVAIVWAGCSK